MSDLPEQHDQEKSADIKLEESEGKERAETKPAEETEVVGEEKEVQVKQPVVDQDPSVTEEKKADVDSPTKPEATETVASQKEEEEVKEKQAEATVEKAQDERSESVEEKVEGGNAVDTSEKEVKQSESEQAPKSNEPVSTNVSADPSPAISLAALRPLSPSSRTSTPPLTATTTAPAAKKFSAMNVNKKFLSKTGSPSPAGASAAAKLNPLASRPISSPVPIAAPSSRLLSTTLTTVTAKPSVSPQPPSSASTSSPWAKPVLPASDSSSSNTKRGTSFSSTAPMGSGQGIASKPAWRAVGADGRRAGMGVNRDFPTASEVAEGKRAAASSAQAHADAQAAQAEALMQGLNAFTNFEPGAHRWDDEDDEDDIIDFGDGAPAQSTQPEAPRPSAPTDQPVTKSERFVEDFDRSWPRSAQAPVEERLPSADHRKRESDRVLFNASSNRLEAKASRPTPPQQPQPTKLMSRPEPPSTDRTIPGRGPPARQLPPHLANAPDKGRSLPPHMANVPEKPAQEAGRTAWGPSRDQGRQAPPHGSRQELPPQSAVFDDSRTPNQSSTFQRPSHPPARTSGERVPTDNHPPPPPATAPASAPPTDIGESQAAEMHTAAEKARLRRQAEEEERRAAADRARQKAKELEAKFGPKPAKPQAESSDTTTNTAPKPPITSTPSYTIAQRPKAQTETSQTGPPAHAPTGPSNLPSRPSVGEASRPRDDQWRNKPEQSKPSHTSQAPPRDDQQQRPFPARNRPARPNAEAFFEKSQQAQSPPTVSKSVDESATVAPVVHLPGMPREAPHDHGVKKDEMINDMLARIKAAMGDRPEEATAEESSSQGRPNGRQAKAGQSAKTAAPTQPAQAPAPLEPVDTFFDVTEAEVPRSPAPAWRTYTVKLPKEIKDVPELSHSQRLALSRTIPAPKGWLMSYNPPLDLNPGTLSVTDLLLPPYGAKSNMHQKAQPAPTPLVSIPQTSYVPFVKGSKAGSSSYKSRQAENAPNVPEDKRNRPAQHAAPSRPGLADRWRIQETPSTSAPEPAVTQNAVDLLDAPPPKAKGPAKGPAKTNTPARFEGMAIGADDSAEPDLKSGVRFMVSSELEGDSLLDEVNKMSLDSVEETQGGAAANGPSQEPRSPSQHGLPTGSLSRTHPTSPNGLPPWTNQREHLKQVWEQSSGSSSEAKLPTATPGSDSTPASTYSSANGPSVNDTATPQQLPYPSQTFSPTQNAFQVRYPAGSPHHMMSQNHQSSDSYSSAPKHGSSAVNGYPANGYTGMSQQSLWSAPAFGSSMASPSYGYASKPAPNPLDQKAAMAFNSAGGSKDMAQYAYSSMTSPQHYGRSPYGSFSPSYTPQQAQQMQHHQQQQQRMTSSPNGTYGYAGYNGPSNHATRGATMSGRFAHTQTNGSGEEYGYNGQEGQGQYYGQSQSHNGVYHQSGAGGAETPTGPTGHGSYHAGGSRRKMW